MVIRWLKQFGILEDEALNVVVLDGEAGQTVSIHAADDQKTARWAAILCAILSFVVQHDHCADQRNGIPMTTWSYVRAAIAINAVLLVIGAILYAAWSFT